ncbi:MAG: UPF0175 family protein [Salinigranum sp.]
MTTHSFTAALTLYRSGTLSLAQSAHMAGVTEAEFSAELARYGISVRETGPVAASAAGTRSDSAV